MKKRILIVDDSEFVRNFHAYILQSAGYDVVATVDGCDGLEKLYTHEFDLILTDINMRLMDGYELIRRIRSDLTFQHLPIIILSTKSHYEDQMRGFGVGADLYLTKPCSPELMIESVRLLLRQAAETVAEVRPCPS